MKKSKVTTICVSIILVLALIVGGCVGFYFHHRHKTMDKLTEAINTEWEKTANDEQPEFLDLLDEKSSFECKSFKKEKSGYYTVTASVKSPDISKAIHNFSENNKDKSFTKEELSQEIYNMIANASIKSSEQTVTVIIDNEGNYHVTFTQGFIDGMFGYIYSDFLKSISNK